MGRSVVTRELWANKNHFRFGIYKEEVLEKGSSKSTNAAIRYFVFGVMGTIVSLLVCFIAYDTISGNETTSSRSQDTMKRLLFRNATQPYFLPSSVEEVTLKYENYTVVSTTQLIPSINESSETVTESLFNETFTMQNFVTPRAISNNIAENNTNASEFESRTIHIGKYFLPSLHTPKSRSNKVRFVETKNNLNTKGKNRGPYEYEVPEPSDRNSKFNDPSLQFEDGANQPYTHASWKPTQIPLQNLTMEDRIMNNIHHQQPRPFRTGSRISKRPLNVYKNSPNAMSPYYGFASPSHIYPQLSNYQYPSDLRNIQDIIKFMQDNSHGVMLPSFPNNQHLLSILQTHPGHKAVKFSGVYKGPNDDDDAQNAAESIGEIIMANKQNSIPVPSSLLNGHAYIADPFHEYKPSDPSEVNLLASNDFPFTKTESQLYPHNVRFNQGWKSQRNVHSNDFFPRPPINFGKPTISPSSINGLQQTEAQQQMYPGKYTTAIYKPFGKEPSTASSSNSGTKKKKSKPFSVMLDIYPMTDGVSTQESSFASQTQVQPYPIPTTQLRPPKSPRFPVHHGFAEFAEPTQDQNEIDNKHQMVVHLNLYPRKKKNISANNRNDVIHSFQIEVKSDSFAKKNSELQSPTGPTAADQMELPLKIWKWAQGNLVEQQPTSVQPVNKKLSQNHSEQQLSYFPNRIHFRKRVRPKKKVDSANTILKPLARSDDKNIDYDNSECIEDTSEDVICRLPKNAGIKFQNENVADAI